MTLDGALCAELRTWRRDFRAHPGFAFIGNGGASRPLHNPGVDFNDDALPHGTNFLVRIVRDRLPIRGPQP